MKRRYWKLLCGAAAAAMLASAGLAHAQDKSAVQFDIPAQPLTSALNEFGIQSGSAVLFKADVTGAKLSRAFSGASDPETALMAMLDGTGLSYRREGQAFVIVSASDPQSGSAAGDGADSGTVQALIVTAQKREENIQDVPIAISAFSEKSLEEQKIEGGFDLLKAIPNVTFSKNNFTSYNFSIRGIGTKAVSATTDPGVAVSFNNVALIQNRLFEQEYFDIERVEVLRGPQGTLYGRNATAGVINVISAEPDMTEFKGWIKGEVGNYHTKRISAMVNVPLIGDKLAVRFAGALTDRAGYDFNTATNHPVNGRDLWSGRITIGFNPTESIRSNLIWERFNEDDDRARTGKQLCHHDAGLSTVGSFTVDPNDAFSSAMVPAMLSQGCKPGSLYEDAAYGTPNGLSLPFLFGAIYLGDCHALGFYPIGHDADGCGRSAIKVADPYGDLMQSKDLRVFHSVMDPTYRANADVVEFNVDVDFGEYLTLSSQTAYDKDSVYSTQDFNRFHSAPVFNDTSQFSPGLLGNSWADLAPGGEMCDPQIGCSKTLAGFDLSQAKSRQFTQELRLQSSFDGPLNFSLGANYTRFDVLVDYYVFFNGITSLARSPIFNFQPQINYCLYTGGIDSTGTGFFAENPGGDIRAPGAVCPYIDPNPIESIDGQGHNYFRSKNPYHLKSASVFGELYWEVSDTLKLTAGLRYNDDKKRFTPIPSQILTAPVLALGTVNIGYPEDPDINQHWGKFTGRLGVDWKPELSFTDQTMIYAFYSRGYKGGGANPPGIGFAPSIQAQLPKDYGPTFEPEFVDAFEVGAKNTLMGGALTLNGDVFFYNYKDYQVSQIKDRTAVNENFDAKTWGGELQAIFAPSHNLQIIANLGYLDTEIGKGERSIDIMNRTQDDPNYVIVKPWPQFPSNCIAPTVVVAKFLADRAHDNLGGPIYTYDEICGPSIIGITGYGVLDPNFGDIFYDPANYPEINGGAGKFADLSGKELPNAPHWTANLGVQYGFDFLEGWRATVRGDAYWQSQSWARVYNLDPYDKLHGWYNVNLSLWLERPDDGLKIELYAKNILDKTPITDAFLNSDDSALTTNVFTLDPRLIGLSIKKDF